MMTTPAPYRIGIDLGGTKTEVVLLDPEGHPQLRERAPTPRRSANEYEAILKNTVRMAEHALTQIHGHDSTIGICIPGIIDAGTGRVINANITSLIEHPFQQDITRQLGRAVAMENDADCFTLAESLQGAGKGFAMVFGIILGTGVGGGLCFNGQIYRGRHGIAGEWGHMAMNPDGQPCFCGNRGCAETLISGTGLAAAYQRAHGRPLPAEAIVAGHRQGEPDCCSIFEQFLEDFGRSLGGLISILDPDAVVIGGGLSNIDELYTIGAARAYRYAFHPTPRTPILKNALGDSAGVFGAAWIGR
jgi:fructokinase